MVIYLVDTEIYLLMIFPCDLSGGYAFMMIVSFVLYSVRHIHLLKPRLHNSKLICSQKYLKKKIGFHLR